MKYLVFIAAVFLLQSARVLAQDAAPPAGASEPAATSSEDSMPPAPPPAEPSPAEAEPVAAVVPGSIKDASDKQRPLGISLMGWIPWWYGIGIGVKGGVEIPIVPNGFISSLNDSVSLEPSLSLAYVDYGILASSVNTIHIVPALAGIWSFHLSERFRVYGAMALGYSIVSYTGDTNGYYDNFNFSYFYAELTGGIGYKLSDVFALRAELGWHGLRGGIQLLL